MSTWTALLASWSSKVLSITRLGQYLGSGGNLDYLLDRTDRLIATSQGVPVTISSGAATIDTDGYSFFTLAAETGTADDVDNINGANAGDVILVRADTGDTITLKHGTGNIFLAGGIDVTLSGYQLYMLHYSGSFWRKVS